MAYKFQLGAAILSGTLRQEGAGEFDDNLTIGAAQMSEADLEKLDGITNGTIAANKAIVVDGNLDASGFRNFTGTGAVTAGTSFIIGSADLNETDMEKLDGITNGTGAANKALVLDGSRDIGNINILSAAHITASVGVSGSLVQGTQAQFIDLGAGTLSVTDANISGDLTVDGNTTLGNATSDTTDIRGVVSISDHDGSSLGLRLGSTLITSTAAELNLVDGFADHAATLNADSMVFFDAGTSQFRRESLVDYAASLAGGNGIDASNGVLFLDMDELSSQTITVATDEFAFINSSGGTVKESIADLAVLMTNGNNGLGASSGVFTVQLTGAVALDGDRVGLSGSVAGAGLSFVGGGATGTSIDTLAVDAAELVSVFSAVNIDVTADSMVILDADGNAVRSEGLDDYAAAIAGDGIVASNGSLALDLKTNSGVEIVSGELAAKVDSDALQLGASGIDLKDTIAGDRSFSGNITIAGDLEVQGDTITMDVTNLNVEDNLIGLGYTTGSVAGALGDRGLVMGLTGENAVSMFWDESGDQFAFARTTSVPTDTQISVAAYADLKAKKVIADEFSGGLVEAIQQLSSNTTLTDFSSGTIIKANSASGTITITLPPAAGAGGGAPSNQGRIIKIKKVSSSNNVIIAANGSEKIDDSSTITLESPFAAVSLICDGSNYFVM